MVDSNRVILRSRSPISSLQNWSGTKWSKYCKSRRLRDRETRVTTRVRWEVQMSFFSSQKVVFVESCTFFCLNLEFDYDILIKWKKWIADDGLIWEVEFRSDSDVTISFVLRSKRDTVCRLWTPGVWEDRRPCTKIYLNCRVCC